MQLLQSSTFKRIYKKLPSTSRETVDQAIRHIMNNPTLGDMKAGDLAGIRVYKFKLGAQLTLLAYKMDAASECLMLMAIGPHENFYRDLKH